MINETVNFSTTLRYQLQSKRNGWLQGRSHTRSEQTLIVLEKNKQTKDSMFRTSVLRKLVSSQDLTMKKIINMDNDIIISRNDNN